MLVEIVLRELKREEDESVKLMYLELLHAILANTIYLDEINHRNRELIAIVEEAAESANPDVRVRVSMMSEVMEEAKKNM